VPTNDGLTVALVAWPIEVFEVNRRDLVGNYLKALETVSSLAERIQGATRESRVVGRVMHNFYRQSYGPGWALVGDAGYHKDAVTAQGISDAFRDAESVAGALDVAFSGQGPFERAMAGHQEARDATTVPMFELTCQLASFAPPTPEEGALFAAIAADHSASIDFVSTFAGTMPVQDFFDPGNLERYLAA
jgi:2-polyprenyl-6-methoxyphenol hydroxylase-like FAD-dependent oxidoreductase